MLPFIDDILKYDSLSIVGLEKNTGKTECLKYVLNRLPVDSRRIAVTSIGIDGETVDQVTRTQKPEITLPQGMYFATSEAHYKLRRLVSELVDVSDENTSLGRVVTARALTTGKVLLSGPPSAAGLKRWMGQMRRLGVDLTVVDGALSRMSSASPAVSRSMILATGAAFSPNVDTLVSKTAFVVQLINLPLAGESLRAAFDTLDRGTWWLDDEGALHRLSTTTSLAPSIRLDEMKGCRAIFVAGALVDSFVEKLQAGKVARDIEIVVRDFTKIFITPQRLRLLLKAGARLTVLQKSKLLAVTVNPTSPGGFTLDSAAVCHRLAETIGLPVYDLLKAS